ncbi:MAG: glycosyltransferase family 4 protein [Lentisphaeria bacterium]|nr:glycosyltransferase family 4 protein [Lentisphaeria bacterium]
MAQSFLNKGYENTFIGIRPHFFSSLDMSLLRRKYGLTRDIELITFPRIRGLKMIYYLYQIKKFVKKYNPDLIYTRSIFLAYKLLNLNKKIVFECHDRLTEEELDKFKTVCNSENLIKIVLISGALKTLFQDEYKISADRIVVAHDGVDIERFANPLCPADARKELDLPEKFTVTYSGHLYDGRGIDVIFELAKIYSDVNFIIVGGREEHIQSHKETMKKIGLTNMVFIGYVDNSSVPGYLFAADVLLMPYQEKVRSSGNTGNISEWMSPLKMFEYMAASRGIISSDLPVLHEVLNDKNCQFCPPADYDAWSKALARYIEDPVLRTAHGKQAYEDVADYTWDKRVENIMSAIQL